MFPHGLTSPASKNSGDGSERESNSAWPNAANGSGSGSGSVSGSVAVGGGGQRESTASVSSAATATVSTSTEHARTRAQLAVMKRALIEEQNAARELRMLLRAKETQLRDAANDADLLRSHNDSLARRIEALSANGAHGKVITHKASSSTLGFVASVLRRKPSSTSVTSSVNENTSRSDMELLFEQMEAKAIENEDLKEQLKSTEAYSQSVLIKLTESHDALSSLSSKHDALIANNALLNSQIQKLRDSFDHQKKVFQSRIELSVLRADDWRCFAEAVRGVASQLSASKPSLTLDPSHIFPSMVDFVFKFKKYTVSACLLFETVGLRRRQPNIFFTGFLPEIFSRFVVSTGGSSGR
ncbi:hypothetical protein BC830DRAFT_469378 [Chytriomyces sp. MP71]|nr:hypothetical protein BC830DRAFT_469378 [Chytriomyces sp. MP71]